MNRRYLITLLPALGVLFFLTGTLEARKYNYLDLGTLPGGTQSEAWALNDKTQIAGWAGHTEPGQVEQTRAARWDLASRTIYDLGAGDGSAASAINNLGQIVGAFLFSDPANARAFFWDPAPTPSGQILQNTLGGAASWANGINDQGQVVGDALNGSGLHQAFLWDTVKKMQGLGTLGGSESFASDINNLGQIAGTSLKIVPISNPPGAVQEYRACQWDASTKAIQDLGTLAGGDESAALAINNHGQVVGWSSASSGGYDHAFLLTPGKAMYDLMQDMKTLTGNYSQAWGINDRGQVVGEYGVASLDTATSYAFIWTAAEGMQDLNSLTVNLPVGVTLEQAFDINEKGWIVGFTAANRGFLLTPIAVPPLELLQDN